jgi:hypothetical protein
MPALPHPVSTTIKVYRDSPRFETVAKYWMLPLHVLKELYVCTVDLPTDEDGDYCGDWSKDSAMLLVQYPGCVFVYIEA